MLLLHVISTSGALISSKWKQKMNAFLQYRTKTNLYVLGKMHILHMYFKKCFYFFIGHLSSTFYIIMLHDLSVTHGLLL